MDHSEPEQQSRPRRLSIPWPPRRPGWRIALALLLVSVCVWVYVRDLASIISHAHRLAYVESGIQAAVTSLRIDYARQSATAQALLDLAADGKQELLPAWRSTIIAYERSGQSFQATVQEAQERVRIAQQLGADNAPIKSLLAEVLAMQEKLQADMATIVRLTEEGRSDDVAAMHVAIQSQSEAIEQQLIQLVQHNQLALIGAAREIRTSGKRAFWTGLLTFALATALIIRWWSRKQRAIRRAMEIEQEEPALEPDQFARVTEQVLAERFLMRGVHVLVAEDDIGTRRLLARVFDDAGAVVTVASDGSRALNQFRRAASSGHPVQLVILDLMMPEMDGLQVAMQLRDVECFEGPILALTAVSDAEVRGKCLEAGFDDYMAKPIDRQRLLQLATDYLGKIAVAD